MSMNREGRVTRPEVDGGTTETATWTGNRGLQLEEPLLFEIGDTDTTGVDVDPLDSPGETGGDLLGGLRRERPIGLAGLSEPETVRH